MHGRKDQMWTSGNIYISMLSVETLVCYITGSDQINRSGLEAPFSEKCPSLNTIFLITSFTVFPFGKRFELP